MASKIDPGRLNKEELTYELKIRGLENVGTMEQMRSTLRRMLKLERSGDSLTYPDYSLDYNEEVKNTEDKIKEIEDLIKNLNTGGDSGQYKKIVAKATHVLMRVDRIKATDDDRRKQRSQLLAKVLQLQEDLGRRVKQIKIEASPIVDLSMLSVRGNDTGSSDSDGDDLGNNLLNSTQIPTTVSTIKSMPVIKWNLTFSGKPKEMSVLAFIERIDELSIARHVSGQTLFESAADLFTDHALIWFRANHRKFSNWNDLCKGLKEQFLERNHDEKLFQQIKERKQRDDESIGIYFAYMKNAFARLSVKIPEVTQLNILRENVKPFFQMAIVRDEPRTIDELESICVRLERRCASIDTFSSTPVKRWTVEPDLMYIEPEPSTSSITQTSNRTPTRTNSRLAPITCWNCSAQGHSSYMCSKPRRKYYKCGTPNPLRGRLVENSRPTITTTPVYENFSQQQIILDYILSHAENDQRPYLEVTILGKKLLGLLDSGATRTVVGKRGWKILQDLNLPLNVEDSPNCTMANGSKSQSSGSILVPMKLIDKLRLINVLVLPDLDHVLILGSDFWKQMEIIPDLRRDVWKFSNEEEIFELNTLESNLNADQRRIFEGFIAEKFKLMGNSHIIKYVYDNENHKCVLPEIVEKPAIVNLDSIPVTISVVAFKSVNTNIGQNSTEQNTVTSDECCPSPKFSDNKSRLPDALTRMYKTTLPALRRKCIRKKRIWTRLKSSRNPGDPLIETNRREYNVARKNLRAEIKSSKYSCWNSIFEAVDVVDWGDGYCIVCIRTGVRTRVELNTKQKLQVVEELFPQRPVTDWEEERVNILTAITLDDFSKAAALLKSNKAPSSEGIPSEAVKLAVSLHYGVFPDMLIPIVYTVTIPPR
ncbi:hypothetical protein NQ314_011113 [Rhamnusium bicolor]|uniref:Peptidase A2 domain-containing protein n=1 Tax=Rhamnusium bicolor TaxID=1586634 RepID=A0AAV8XMA5_9CUCU|nr:hypothetical protein NQ314_011113 [Rhamnusium bicolor]